MFKCLPQILHVFSGMTQPEILGFLFSQALENNTLIVFYNQNLNIIFQCLYIKSRQFIPIFNYLQCTFLPIFMENLKPC